MVTKLGAPLGSPTLAATTAQFRNRLPAQFRRNLPLYFVTVVLVLFVLNSDLFRPAPPRQPIIPVPDPPDFDLGPGPAPGHIPVGLSTYVRPTAEIAHEPARVRTEFPRKIWQTWKVNPLRFEERDLNTARTWLIKNPDYRYEVLTDDNDLRYVEWHYGPEGFDRPDIVTFYRDVKAAIVKADLLRYLIMYAEGGVYADIDVEALKPAGKFIPPRYDQKDIDMVVGVEIDEPDWKDHRILGPKSRSFCQWTFMCKPQLPVMMRLIEHIMAWLNGVAEEQNVPLGEVTLDFDQIISGTGPSAFTGAILAEMEAAKTDPDQKISWDLFHDLQESRVVSRVLVLTVEAFAAGQGHSESGNHDARAALVKHHYHASNWPSRHPRYTHPAYGEVEKCNWNDECVHKWDKDVAGFLTLPKEEQRRIIEEKEKERKEKEEREKKDKEEAERRRREDEDAARKRKEEEEAARKKKEAEEAERKKKKEMEAETKRKGWLHII